MKLPRIKVTLPFVCVLAVLWLIDSKSALLPTISALMIHEIAHVIALLLCGGKPDRIEFCAAGIKVNVENFEYMPYFKEIIIAAAGPVAGFITAVLAFAAAEVINYSMLYYFVGANIAVSLINLIPVYPLDGGRIILSFMLMFLQLRAAYYICYVLNILSVGILFGLCAVLAVKGILNPTLILFSLYAAMCGIKNRSLL